MPFTFSLERVHMYNQILHCHTPAGPIKVVVEDSPNADEGLLVWENEFGPASDRRDQLVGAFANWAAAEGITYKLIRHTNRC